MLLKFYFFAFLYYRYHQASTRNEEDKYSAPFTAVLMTFAFLLLWIVIILEVFFHTPMHWLFRNRYYFIHGLGIPAAYLLYWLLAKDDKYKAIYEEFESHPWNTKTNRMLCWAIWIISFLVPIVAIAYYKGIG